MAEMQVGRKVDLVHTTIFLAKILGSSAPCKSLQGLQEFGNQKKKIKEARPGQTKSR